VPHIAASLERFAPCVECRSAPGRRPSCAFGVAHTFAAIASGIPAPLPLIPFALTSSARASHVVGSSRSFGIDELGVGHSRAASVSVVPECRPLSVEYAAAPELFASVLVAVGQDEQSLASVRRSDIGRAEHTPFRIEPERGKVGKNVGEPKRNVACDVLEEPERGTGLVEDSCDVRPEVALVGVAEPSACDAERLARVAACDEIHRATPRAAIEGCEIVPDRRAIQRRVFHPGHEDGRGEGFPLDVANGTAPLGQSEVDAADAGAERDGS
jgi:hypothetical protein